jgi:cell division septum initiation protein DivIVA
MGNAGNAGGGGGNHEQPDAETLMRRVVDIINNAKPIPLSATVRLENRDEVVELMNEALERLPGELRQARWMLKERAEFLAKVQREADEILESARVRAERMVQRTEIVREAKLVARNTVQDARDLANRLKHEAEDYCDQKLAAFEIVLERTIKTVHAGRDKLSATPGPNVTGPHSLIAGVDQAEDTLAGEDTFFDQDRL